MRKDMEQFKVRIDQYCAKQRLPRTAAGTKRVYNPDLNLNPIEIADESQLSNTLQEDFEVTQITQKYKKNNAFRRVHKSIDFQSASK